MKEYLLKRQFGVGRLGPAPWRYRAALPTAHQNVLVYLSVGSASRDAHTPATQLCDARSESKSAVTRPLMCRNTSCLARERWLATFRDLRW
jgi:hypothetical protein